VQPLRVTDETKGHPDYKNATGKNESLAVKAVEPTPNNSSNLLLNAEHVVGHAVGKTSNAAIQDAILAAAAQVSKDNSLVQKMSNKAKKNI
jgi:hypothetical protein